tara:strand:+ start:807 stop:920 length:114 start_codon:yes stop_codon:yes gene_type:complete
MEENKESDFVKKVFNWFQENPILGLFVAIVIIDQFRR